MDRLLVAVTVVLLSICSSVDADKRYYETYLEAAASLRVGRYAECAEKAGRAIEVFRDKYVKTLRCIKNTKDNSFRVFLIDEHLPEVENYFLKRAFQVAPGLERNGCKDHLELTTLHGIRNMRYFLTRRPYKLRMKCLLEMGDYLSAATAGQTYLSFNKKDTEVVNILNEIKQTNNLDSSAVEDLEILPFQRKFIEALNAYKNERHTTVVSLMEAVLSGYYDAVEQCGHLCEMTVWTPADQLTDTYALTLYAWKQVMQCRQRSCRKPLYTFAGQGYEDDFLAIIYHYLQFGYYQLGNLNEAIKAAVSYSLFKPHDDEMYRNLEYYKARVDDLPEELTARPDAAEYRKRVMFDDNSLKLAYHMRNVIRFDEQIKSKIDLDRPATLVDDGLDMIKPFYVSRQKKPVDDYNVDRQDYVVDRGNRARLEEIERLEGIRLSMTEKELRGPDRFVAENLLSEEQCADLVRLAEIGATQGDGYSGQEHRNSPFTDYERFEGLGINRASEMAADREVDQRLVQLYLSASERARSYTETYFHLNSTLHFTYTHLVCRTSLDSEMSGRESDELSHPIHSDNCHIQPDGSCPRKRPAYIERDYSGLVYLTNDYEGGEFIFAYRNMSQQSMVKPKCGTLVGFHAGNYHGVNAVTKGKRCAVAMWFTLDPNFREVAQIEARYRMEKLALANNGPDLGGKIDSTADLRSEL